MKDSLKYQIHVTYFTISQSTIKLLVLIWLWHHLRYYEIWCHEKTTSQVLVKSKNIYSQEKYSIARSLAYIINLSLQSGVFPNEWKSTRISPIFKNGAKTEPGNYRPVSILPVISKFIERIVHQQLYKYLNDNNLLSFQQSGFRKKPFLSN